MNLLSASLLELIRRTSAEIPDDVQKAILNSLDLRFPATDARPKDVAIMVEKMEQLNKIVEQLLDYARPNEPQVVPVNINPLIDDLGLHTYYKLVH